MKITDQLKTGLLLLAGLVAYIAYDIYMVIHNSDADISHVLQSVFRDAPFTVFLFGYVCGHLTWPIINLTKERKMKLLLALLLTATVLRADPMTELPSDNHRTFAKSRAQAISREVADTRLRALAAHTDAALNHIVAMGVMKLREAGDVDYANLREWEWTGNFSGFLSSRVAYNEYDIGDHDPLLQWLAAFYDHLEQTLGVKTCKSLHLSDIKTFNFCIPVVFHPCTFPMGAVTIPREDEYRNHFNSGAVYYGLVPVVTYWVVDIACTAATQGGGVGWLCGPVGGAAEWLMSKTLGPRLSDRVFEGLCNERTCK